jgi:hypothetical protein
VCRRWLFLHRLSLFIFFFHLRNFAFSFCIFATSHFLSASSQLLIFFPHLCNFAFSFCIFATSYSLFASSQLRVHRKRFSVLPPTRTIRIISDVYQPTLGGSASPLGDAMFGCLWQDQSEREREILSEVQASRAYNSFSVYRARFCVIGVFLLGLSYTVEYGYPNFQTASYRSL